MANCSNAESRPARFDRTASIFPLFAVLFLVLPLGSASAARVPEVAVVAFALSDRESVFESEARGAAAAISRRFYLGPQIIRANTGRSTEATIPALAAALRTAGRKIDAQRDVLIVVLISHGSRAGLAVRADGLRRTLTPARLAAMLDLAGVQHRVVIISACYSGVFIGRLASSDTLVITAADARHKSFGLKHGAHWTFFGDALFNIAMRHTTNLTAAFAMARAIIGKHEREVGFGPSNPQIAGGQNVDHLLTRAMRVPVPAPKAHRHIGVSGADSHCGS
jgi:hypothetical protein